MTTMGSASSKGGVPAILYDFNACDDFVHSHYRVVQEVFIPSAKIAFNATKFYLNPIAWNAFPCDKPRRQQTGDRLHPPEIPLNARDIEVPEELVQTLVAYVAASDNIKTKWAETMLALTTTKPQN